MQVTAYPGNSISYYCFPEMLSISGNPVLILSTEALRLPCFLARPHCLFRWAGFSSDNDVTVSPPHTHPGLERCVGLSFDLFLEFQTSPSRFHLVWPIL